MAANRRTCLVFSAKQVYIAILHTAYLNMIQRKVSTISIYVKCINSLALTVCDLHEYQYNNEQSLAWRNRAEHLLISWKEARRFFAEWGTHRQIIWLYDSMDLQHSTFDFHANVIIHKASKVQLARSYGAIHSIMNIHTILISSPVKRTNEPSFQNMGLSVILWPIIIAVFTSRKTFTTQYICVIKR